MHRFHDAVPIETEEVVSDHLEAPWEFPIDQCEVWFNTQGEGCSIPQGFRIETCVCEWRQRQIVVSEVITVLMSSPADENGPVEGEAPVVVLTTIPHAPLIVSVVVELHSTIVLADVIC